MEQNTRNSTESTQNKTNLKNSPLVEVNRKFQAPIERVWEAWSKPELTKQWWGPENYSCPEAKIDFREGGGYLLAMKGPDGKVIWSGGVYKEIIPNEKIVCTDQFMDKDRNVISAKELGMTGDWPDTLYMTVEFEKLSDDECKMHIIHEGIPKEMHDDCVQGWSSSIDKLQKLVERS